MPLCLHLLKLFFGVLNLTFYLTNPIIGRLTAIMMSGDSQEKHFRDEIICSFSGLSIELIRRLLVGIELRFVRDDYPW